MPAVAIVSKNGLLFILDRRTGEPIHPVEERAVPASDVPNEQAWPTQPFPVRPPPLARNSFSPDELATVTPELHAFCESFVTKNRMRSGGPYLPVGYDAVTINFPGLQGGANWGGASFDPTRGYLFVNTLDMGQVTSLVDSRRPDAGCTRTGERSLLRAHEPSHVSATAVGTTDRRRRAQRRDRLAERARRQRQPARGAAANRPAECRRFDCHGGRPGVHRRDRRQPLSCVRCRERRELWSTKLDASAHATPITYLGKSGKQFVVVTATGGSFLGSPVSGDAIVAFALPDTCSRQRSTRILPSRDRRAETRLRSSQLPGLPRAQRGARARQDAIGVGRGRRTHDRSRCRDRRGRPRDPARLSGGDRARATNSLSRQIDRE